MTKNTSCISEPMRRCFDCELTAPLAAFPAQKSGPQGRNKRCRKCALAYDRLMYAQRRSAVRDLKAEIERLEDLVRSLGVDPKTELPFPSFGKRQKPK